MIKKILMRWMPAVIVAIFVTAALNSRADDARANPPLSVVIYANKYPEVAAAIKLILEKAGIGPVQTTASLASLQASALTGVNVVIMYCDNELPAQSVADLRAFVSQGGGLVALHHTAYSASFSPGFETLIGGSFAGAVQGGEQMGPYTVRVEDPTHPVAYGIKEFQLPNEERYIQMTIKEGDHLLFSSDGLTQKNLGWTRTEGSGRVLFFQPCHYLPTLNTTELGQILVNGVHWAAEAQRDSDSSPPGSTSPRSARRTG